MLTIIEGRVLGCLLEKERTTPDQYPLTLNALVTACNQSTSREPVMHLAEHEVEGALGSLKVAGLLRYVHPAHGRSVTRYRQVAVEQWQLEPDQAALIAVLLLRGPQSAAELRARTERLHEFASPEAVEAVLRPLAESGRVRQIDRRWQQLLAEEPEPSSAPLAASSSAPRSADRLAELEARVARLEAVIADLLG